MKDLFDWQKDIKKKDKSIRKHGVGLDMAPLGSAQPISPPIPTAPPQAPLAGLPAPRGRALTGQVAHAPPALQAPGILPAAKGPAAAATSSAAATGRPGAELAGAAPSPPSGGKKLRKKKKIVSTAGGGVLPPGAERLKGTAASHTYAAYKKWDKFDIDAALKSDDEEEGAGTKEESEYETDSDAEQPPSLGVSTSTTSPPNASVVATPPKTSTFNRTASSNPPSSWQHAPAASASPNTPVVIAPRESLSLSELSERSTTRSAAPGTTSEAAPADIYQRGGKDDLPPIRSQEPQSSEAWRARGNDLFKVWMVWMMHGLVMKQLIG